MSNEIIQLLNLENNDNIRIDAITDLDGIKVVEMTITKDSRCPLCNSKGLSKGNQIRIIKHPIIKSNEFKLELHVKYKRRKCSNVECGKTYSDKIPFVVDRKRVTKYIPLRVCEELKDPNKSFASVAKDFNMSESSIRNIFMKHVHFDKGVLSDVICIDEVYMNIGGKDKYVFVVLDFYTKEPIDIVESRYQEDIINYFFSFTKSERNLVEYVICDMYKPYIKAINTCFIKAKVITDSFHVISKLNNEIIKIIARKKSYYRLKLVELEEVMPKDMEIKKEIFEVKKILYLLQKHPWVLLKSRDNVKNSAQYYNSFIGRYVDTQDIIYEFNLINKDFKKISEYKEMYVRFNKRTYDNRKEIEKELNFIIDFYKQTDIKLFIEFSKTLKTHFTTIVNSFVTVEYKGKKRRLSNGPIEGFNRKVKDLKRSARNYLSFDVFRKRMLLISRSDFTFKN